MAKRRPKSFSEALPGLGRVLGHFRPYIFKHRPLVAGSMAGLLAEVALRLLEPWPLKFVFDRIIVTAPNSGLTGIAAIDNLDTMALLTLCAVALVGVTGLRAVAAYYSTVGFAQVGNRVLTEVRSDLYRHLQRLSLSFHTKAKQGDLVVRLINDVGMLKEVSVTAFLPLLGNALILVGMLSIMLWLQWELALLALLVFPLFGLRSMKLGQHIQEVSRKQRKREGVMAATAAESIGAIKAVQALGLVTVFDRTFSSQNKKSLKDDVKAKRLAAKLERTFDVLIAVATALVLFAGARFVLLGKLTPGDLLIFLTYLKYAFQPVRNFAKYTGRLAKASAAGERILDLFEKMPTVRDQPGALPVPDLKGAIRFEKVCFSYEAKGPSLNDITFEVLPGQRVAIVGPSGSGKSTLVSLLLRLYDPHSGRILVDGHDLKDYQIQSLRKQMSVVLQDDLLFGMSIRDNIALSRPEATNKEIGAAARLAQAHSFIRHLPRGYYTVLGERGVTLSGGQRRRLALARALLRKTSILILDEPTAGLDETSEREVVEALDSLPTEMTTFLITHNMRLAARADLVLYLEGGRLLEAGRHNVLLQARGPYAALFGMQTAEQCQLDKAGTPHVVS